MPKATSPLRYPGGKACLYQLMSQTLRLNGFERRRYVEPFAGGCGLALTLLYHGHVSEIHINDVDSSIWAFWHCILERTDELVAFIETVPVTVEEWAHQKAIHVAWAW